MSTPNPENEPQSPDTARETVPPPATGSSAETIQPLSADSVSGSPMTSEIAVPGQLGRYRIESCLGQGAMGAVYKAHDTQLDRVVALKIPKFDASDAAMLERFIREARAAATLSHANICPVHDVGEIDGVHCISMGYIEGRPLSSFVNPDKPLSQKQAVQIVRKLAAGLNEAHSQGVVHRDLKPDNVMIDKKSNPVIMDFGLARRTKTDDIRVTQSGQMLGTPAYMSPEQVEGDVNLMGPQSDIYSLGIILYELLTGRLPYQGSVASVLAQIMKAEPQPPIEIRQNINPELQAICLKMMAARPDDRYATVAEVSRDLIALLKGKPTSLRDTATGVASAGISTGDEGISHLVAAENHPLKDQIGERSRSKASKFRPVQGVLGAVAVVGLLAGYFLFVKVGDQTVRLKIDDPKAKVFVDGDEVRIMDLGATLQLKPGEHGVIVRRGDLIVETRSLTVVDGDNPVLQLDVLEPETPTELSSTGEKSVVANITPRAAAEWALRLGISLGVEKNGIVKDIREEAELGDAPVIVRRITIGKQVSVPDDEWHHLSAFKKLTHFYVKGTSFDDRAIVRLGKAPDLELVELAEANVSDKGIEHLAALSKLETLRISGAANSRMRITDNVATTLLKIPSLQTVNLSFCQITDAIVPRLAQMPALKELYLYNNPISDAVIPALKPLGLTRLGLGSTQITDASATTFNEMTALKALVLNSTAFSEGGLTKLTSLKLDDLFIIRCPISKSALDKWMAENPDTRVSVEYGVTISGADNPQNSETVRLSSNMDPQFVFSLLTSDKYEWTKPEKLDRTINRGSYNYAPWFSPDGLSLWYTANLGGNQGYDELFVTRRKSPTAAWETSTNIGAPINGAGKESAATLTADRCRIFFVRTGRIYSAVRSNMDAPWDEPEVINGKGAVARSPVVSGDGRILIVSMLGKTFDASLGNSPTGSNEDIYQLTRDDPNGPWSEPQKMNGPLNSPEVDRPGWVSADGCVLLFESTRNGGFGESDIWVAMRPSLDAPWAKPVNLGSGINSDGHDLTPAFCMVDGTFAFSGKRPENKVFREIYTSRRVLKSSSGDAVFHAGTTVVLDPKTVTRALIEIPKAFAESTDPVVRAVGWALSRHFELVLKIGDDTVQTSSFDAIPDGEYVVAGLSITGSGNWSAHDWHHLKALAPTLEELTVDNANFDDAAIAHLEDARDLKRVTLHAGSLTESGFETLTKLPAIVEVAIGNSNVGGGQQISAASLKALAESDTLETLRISNVALKDEWLQPIGKMSSLRTLALSSTETTENGVAYLRDLKLTELELSGNPLTDTVTLALTEIKPLATLNLSNTEVGDPSCKQLVNLPRLRSLNLSQTKVTDLGLTSITEAKRLAELSLDQTDISNAGLSSLTKLRLLRNLSIKSTKCSLAGVDDFRKKNDKCQLAYSPAEDADLNSPAATTSTPTPVFKPFDPSDNIPEVFRNSQVPAVRTIGWLISRRVHASVQYQRGTSQSSKSVRNFDDVPTVPFVITQVSVDASSLVGKSDWEFLKSLPNLGSFYANVPAFTDDALSFFTGHQSLQDISLNRTSVSDAGVDLLKSLPRLNKLRIYSAGESSSLPVISDDSAASIAKMKNLTTLRLDDTLVTNDGFRQIVSSLPQLTDFAFTKGRIDEDGVAILRGHPRLTDLSLSGPGITDRTLGTVASLPRLSDLSLAEAPITDDGLRVLRGHPVLSSLNVGGTEISDNGLLHLAQVPNLSSLWLYSTRVSDAGLNVLARMPIKYVSLGTSKVTLAGAQALQNSRPKSTIVFPNVKRP